MQILKATDWAIAQAITPQLARWVVGDKMYVIEVYEDWDDPRLPKEVQPDEPVYGTS